jgi:hypothetical protein
MFYRWEIEYLPWGRTLHTERSAQFLVARVWAWAKHHPKYGKRARLNKPPTVEFNGGWYHSWCEGRKLISLSRGHRKEQVLLHELTHALGPETHGRRFQELYLELMFKFLFK